MRHGAIAARSGSEAPRPAGAVNAWHEPPHFDATADAGRLRRACLGHGRGAEVLRTARSGRGLCAAARRPRVASLRPISSSRCRCRSNAKANAASTSRSKSPAATHACTGATMADGTLLRVRHTPPQQSLARDARRRNVRGAFGVYGDVRGPDVVVVDDVMTTGSTLNEIADTAEARRRRACRQSGRRADSLSWRLKRCSTSFWSSRRFPRIPAMSFGCAPTAGARLHLVEPLGFDLSDKQLRRAGLDYHEYAELRVHASFDALLAQRAVRRPTRMFCCTTRADPTSCRRRVRARRLAGVRSRIARASTHRCARDFAPNPAAAPADARRQPQPQPVECGRGCRLRSLATAAL